MMMMMMTMMTLQYGFSLLHVKKCTVCLIQVMRVASVARLRYVGITGGPKIIPCCSSWITTEVKGFKGSQTIHVVCTWPLVPQWTAWACWCFLIITHYTSLLSTVKLIYARLRKNVSRRDGINITCKTCGRKNRTVERESVNCSCVVLLCTAELK